MAGQQPELREQLRAIPVHSRALTSLISQLAMGQAPSRSALEAALTRSTPTLFPLTSEDYYLPSGAMLDVVLEIVSASVRN